MKKNYSDIIEQMNRYHSEDPDVRDSAVIEIVQEHSGLISMVIDKNFSKFAGEYRDDMMSCGKLGIMEALKKYDPEKAKPSTFFTIYIKHEIYDFITRYVMKTTPYYASEIKAVKKAMTDFETVHGKEATIMDISYMTGISTKIVQRALDIVMFGQTKDFETESYLDGIMTEFDESPEDTMIGREEDNAIYKALACLDDIEKQVICLKFGLLDEDMCTNADIAKKVGIPLDLVRRTVNKAITKLRNEPAIYTLFNDNIRDKRRKIQREEIAIVPVKAAKMQFEDLLNVLAEDDEIFEEKK